MSELTVLSTNIGLHDGLYCLSDLHKAAGNKKKHRPQYWLGTEQAKDLISELESENQGRDSGLGPLQVIHGGSNPGTYACKELVYAYAMWISAKFHLAVIRAFDGMVAGKRAVDADEHIAVLRDLVKLQDKVIENMHEARMYTAATPWTPDEDRKMLELRAQGLGFTRIGRRLRRSESSCRHRYNRLGQMEQKRLDAMIARRLK